MHRHNVGLESDRRLTESEQCLWDLPLNRCQRRAELLQRALYLDLLPNKLGAIHQLILRDGVELCIFWQAW